MEASSRRKDEIEERGGTSQHEISGDTAGHTDGTPSERSTPAAVAGGRRKATRQRQQAATRWEDQHGNQRNTNTINSKQR